MGAGERKYLKHLEESRNPVAEASNLGWPVGEYKTEVTVDREVFYLEDMVKIRDEVNSWTYRSRNGRRLVVFND